MVGFLRSSVDRPPGRRFSSRAAAALLFAGTLLHAAAPAEGGEIHAVVRGDGEPLERVFVILTPPGTVDRDNLQSLQRVFTDATGRAVFRDVEPGSYTFKVEKLPAEMVAPEENPDAPPPVVTLVSPDERLDVELRAESGVRVEVTLDVDSAKPATGFRALFQHRASGFELVSRFPYEQPTVSRILAPGVWTVSVLPTPGYLLKGVDYERAPQSGNEVTLDLALDPRPTRLTFRYAAPATLAGRLTVTGDTSQRVYLDMTLLRPGPWIEEAERRGGSRYEKLGTGIRPDGSYELVVPDGRWRIQPAGEALVRSDPPFAELDVKPGEEGRADFTVALKDPGQERYFLVDVTDAGGHKLAGATVEVYPADGRRPALARGTSNLAGTRFEGLPDADYLIAAGHPGSLEGRALLRLTGEEPGSRVQVTLPSGAEVRVLASDGEKGPVQGATFRIDREDAPVDLLVSDAPFVAAKAGREVRTDDSGRARVTGLYPGTYRVTVSSPGGSEMLVGMDEEAMRAELEVELEPDAAVDLLAVVRPAGKVRLALACSDGYPLPATASAYVYKAGDSGEDAVAWHRDRIPATGELALGPLEGGDYVLAVRPAGFTRWSWSPGTYREAEAKSFRVRPGTSEEEVDLGTLRLECAPAVDVVPEVASGAAPPSVREMEVAVRVLAADEERELAPPPTVRKGEGRFEIRGLPRGPARLEVVLRHPHLLPEPALSWQTPLRLERGEYLEIAPLLAGIGGAVEVKGPGTTARLAAPGQEGAEAALAGGSALFPSLRPGTYSAVLCADAACREVLRRWDAVEVRAGETRLLEVEGAASARSPRVVPPGRLR